MSRTQEAADDLNRLADRMHELAEKWADFGNEEALPVEIEQACGRCQAAFQRLIHEGDE